MKTKRFVQLICLLLCIVISVSALGACNGNKNVSSSDQQETASTGDGLDVDTSIDDASDSEDNMDDIWNNDDTNDVEYGEMDDSITEGDSEEASEATQLKVFNSQAPIQTNYMGLSGSVYHAYGFMKNDVTGRVYTDEMMNIELTRLQNAGVRYCRTRYNSAWMWDATANRYNFNSERMNYFYDYANALQDRGISIVLTLGWHLNFIINGSASIGEVSYLNGRSEADVYGENSGYDDSKLSDKYKIYARAARRFGYWYAETLRQCRARGVNNISHLLYFTEPSYSQVDKKEGLYADEYIFICDTIKNKLIKEGVYNTVKHIGPNQGSVPDGDGLLRYVLERKPDLFNVYSAHYYPKAEDATNDVYYDDITETFSSYTKALKDNGVWKKKDFWVDEFYCSSTNHKLATDGPWEGLQTVVGGIVAQRQGIQNISLWQIFDQLWTDSTGSGGEFMNGIHMCGSAPSLFSSSIPRSQYYSVSLFGRYNGYKNGTVYPVNFGDDYNGMYLGNVQLEDGNWTITVVNLNFEETAFEVQFDKAIGKTLYRHLEDAATRVPTTAARLADADRTYVNVKDKFVDTIPAGSVAIYTSVRG